MEGMQHAAELSRWNMIMQHETTQLHDCRDIMHADVRFFAE